MPPAGPGQRPVDLPVCCAVHWRTRLNRGPTPLSPGSLVDPGDQGLGQTRYCDGGEPRHLDRDALLVPLPAPRDPLAPQRLPPGCDRLGGPVTPHPNARLGLMLCMEDGPPGSP